MKLLDIAAEAGFLSTARFYPCFKRLVGESPARYRRSLHFTHVRKGGAAAPRAPKARVAVYG